MIILEGSDQVGKTTLMNDLLKFFPDFESRHLSKLPKTWNSPKDYLHLMTEKIIWDRFHISEPIYAKIRGESSMATPEDFEVIHKQEEKLLVVVITTEPCDLEKRLIANKGREEMYSNANILKANKMYIRYMQGDSSYPLHWNTHWIHCSGGKLFPSSSDIQNIRSLHECFPK